MTRARLVVIAAVAWLFASAPLSAQVTGGVRVTVRDAQELAIADADVTIKAETSPVTRTAKTTAQGEATFPAVPLGRYVVSVTSPGFTSTERSISVASNLTTPLEVTLAVAGIVETAVVIAAPTVNPESTRTATMVERDDILRDPSADRSGSLTMITNNSPGSYMLHDHLHSRGGHGVSWEIDGVPVPSSAMAAVGSQFDPKDVDSLEVNRGGLSAAVGDRPYGVFNVVPRSGFEGHKFGDVTATYGSYQTGNLHVALGNHSENQKFAVFASGSANRTDRGLERVQIPVVHDDAQSYSGFVSMIYSASVHDQFRLVAASRADRFQVPNVDAQQVLGIDDRETGDDTFTNVTWLHSSESGWVLTVSPYFHRNKQRYIGGPNDPLITRDDRTSNYMGAYASWAKTATKYTVRVGTDSFAEHDNSAFGLTETTGARQSVTQRQQLWSSVAATFVEGTWRATNWLALNGGYRFERFGGSVTEHGNSPRVGAAISVPRGGVIRAWSSGYYGAPPTSTISGPLLEFALNQGFGFLPVYGERDHVIELGFATTIRGWTLDVTGYRNRVDNLADHDVLGNSNLLLPLSIANGRVRAFESTLRSPVVAKRLQVHYAFAYQVAEGRGAVTGGMTDFAPPADNGYFFLDHDQRVTFNSGASLDLPRAFWLSGNLNVGSGFLLGDGPDHLPAHVTADLALGRSFGKSVRLRAAATNITNKQYLTGFANSFAGTHWAAPREVSVQLRVKFHY